jgi:hypothetical protein
MIISLTYSIPKFRGVYVFTFLAFLFSPNRIPAQTNPNFNVTLDLDYASAEQCIQLYTDGFVNVEQLAGLRGSKIAASTTGLIAQTNGSFEFLRNYLDSLKSHEIIYDDVFRLEEARKNVDQIKALLQIIKKENFSRRVSATVEQIFPQNARIDANIPLYFVAFGSGNVDAYVRRIVWHGDNPEFVGENQGELTIVVNLARAINYPGSPPAKFITLLDVVAHEVFHAAFGVYKDRSEIWKNYAATHRKPIDALLDLTQNEGIAYYLSLAEAGKGRLPQDWFARTRAVFETFNKNAAELQSDTITSRRTAELIRTANMSGYWDSYGAMTGMFIAREIDNDLGRAALIETIEKGPADFFNKYLTLTQRDSNLPPLSVKIE